MKKLTLWFSFILFSLKTNEVTAAAPSCPTTSFDVSVATTETVDYVVANLGCSDADPGDVLTYTFTKGNTDSQYKVENGQLKLAQAVIKQIIYKFQLEISVSDGTDIAIVNVKVTLTSTNDFTPTASWSPSPIFIKESIPIGTLIGTCTMADGDSVKGTLAGQVRIDFKSPTITAAAKWLLDSHTGQLFTNEALDFDTRSAYTLNMVVTDLDPDNPRTVDTSISVQLLRALDNRPTCPVYLIVIPVLKTATAGTVITTLACTDADSVINTDPAGVVSYELDDTNDATANDLFQINSASGSLELKTTITSPTIPFYEVMIRVKDGGSPVRFTKVLVRVVVTDVPQDGVQPATRYPTDYTMPISMSREIIDTASAPPLPVPGINGLPYCSRYGVTAPVPESVVPNDLAYNLGCVDPDGDTLAYKIIRGDPYKKFKMEEGLMKLNKGLNADARNSFHVRITATDDSTMNFVSTVTVAIRITNINDNTPKITGLPATIEVSENEPFGAVYSICTVTDKDSALELSGQTRVRWENPDDSNNWLLDGVTCSMYVNTELDYETTTSYVLTLLAYDLDPTTSLTSTAILTINIKDENDNAPVCSNSGAVDLQESSGVGAAVGTVTCTDADSGFNKQVSFALDATNAAVVVSTFQVDSTTGAVTLAAILDYDQQTSHEVKILATDGGTPSLSSTSTIQVTVIETNDAPVCPVSTSVTLPEASIVGTPVSTITCTDNNAGVKGQISYQLDATNAAVVVSTFQVDSTTGSVTLKSLLDYDQQTSHEVKILATDGGSPSLSSTSTIQVTVAETNVPPDCPSSSFTTSVPDSSPTGTTVLTVTCTDSNSGVNGQVSYTIDGTSTFEVGSTSGAITLKSGLDYDQQSSYQFKIIVADGGDPSLSSTINIDISVVKSNEAPVCPTSTSVTLHATSTVGTPVSTITCTDADTGTNGQISYQIDATNAAVVVSTFQVDSSSGAVTLKSLLDYDQQTSHEVKILATDGGSPSLSSTSTIQVTVMKAAPPTCTPAISVNITATEPIDTLIADLNCSDPDPGDTITLSFQSGNTDTQFKISGGNILLAKTFTAQVTYQYVMVILAADTNSETATVALTVQVVNVNNNPPVISGLPSPIPVRESDPIGTLIATCTHTDQDPSNTLAGQTRVGISKPFGAAARKWVLDSQSCELYINTLLDYETTKEYKVDILAWDLDPHNPRTTTQQITINVLDVNDNQPSCTEYLLVAPTLSTTAIGAPITTINCTDPDVGNSGLVSFQLDASNSATVTNLFEVDNTGKLTLKSGITGPTPFYEVLIRVQDGGSPSLFTRVLIRVVITDVPQDGPQPNSAFTGVLPPPSPELPTPLDTRNKPALTPTGAANIPVCALYGLTIVIPETTSVGETLYDLRCTDPDGDTLSYSIDKGDGYNKFDVSTGSLKVIKEFNSDFTFKFSLYITVTDDSPSRLSTMIIIGLFVTNSNDNTPVIKNLPSIIEVSEAKPFGAVINKCIINDKDNKHGELPGQTRVGLANPNDAVTKNFLVDSVTCNLYVNTELDFETTTSYVLTLLAWDLDQTAPKTATSTFTVMVTDANDNAPVCPATLSATLAEDAAINTEVETVTCTDADTGDNKKVYFKMDETNTALVKASFDVSGTTGVVTLQASLDYETQTSHEVKIIAYDGGRPSLSFTSTIQVTVTDVNDGTATQTYSAPTYTAKPDVRVSLEQLGPGGAGSYKFTCDFPLDTNPLHYLVKWFIDGYPVYSTPRILNTADVQDLTKLTEAKLAEIGVTTVGFTIKCEFRASFEINSFLGDNSTSDEKFIGIKVLTKTINIKQGEEGIIQIQATAPIGCQTSGCSYPLYTYIEQNGFGCSLKTSPAESCGVSIPAASYSDVYEVKVKGGITYQYGRGISTSTLKLRAPEVFADHPMWSNYVLDDVTVNIEQNTALIEGSKCAAFVDPRIVTFDRGLLDLQVMGTYTLYKRGEQEIQITTYQCDTERNAWCVCGVAIRAGRDVYLMNKCGLEFHDLRYSLCEETSSDVLKVEKFETLYQVYLPTGTRVKVFIRPDNMNVFIYPSVMDIGVSRGLCGNLSGISKDDLILKNGAQSTETVSRARFEPAPIFFNSWKVLTDDSLFVETNYPSLTGYTGGAFAYNADSYQCQPLANPLTGGTGPISSAACNLFSNVNRVVRDELYIPVEKKNCGSGGSRRKRSAPSYTGEEDVEAITLSRSKRNVEWKNGWTLESTEKFCNELFNTSSMVSLCKDLSLVDVYSAKVACVMDIQLTGNNTFSLAAMSSIRSQCIHELNSNETFFVPSIPGQPPIYDLISAVTCPGECTQQGSCIDGICECVDGFGGVDCSVDIRTKPLLVKLHNGGLCDLKIDNCTEVTAFGETFVQTPKTSCKATYFEQKETGEMEISVGVATKPYLESISEAVCQVPERPAQSKPNSYEFVTGYMISFTNDGSTYSKPNYMAIYHSDCQQCDVTSDGVNCTFKTPSCISGGQCYSDGADYEHNSCYTCSANTTHRAWVRKDLDECEDEEEEESMLWVIGAVAGVLISVALMAVIIYLIKRKNKISASRTLLDPEGKLAGNYKKSDAFEHKTAI